MKKHLTAALAIAASCVALFASAPAAQAQGGYHYGAMAVSLSTDHYGFSVNHDSYAEAEDNSVGACITFGGGPDCMSTLSWRNGCGALAISRTHWSYGSGPSLRAAKQRAIANNPGNGAYIEHWSCTRGYSV